MPEPKMSAFISHFQVMNGALSQYQYLGALLLIGSTAILMLSMKNRHFRTLIVSAIATFLAACYLIYGLYIYRELLGQSKILIDAASSEGMISQLRFSYVETLLFRQFCAGCVIFIILGLSIWCSLKDRKIRK